MADDVLDILFTANVGDLVAGSEKAVEVTDNTTQQMSSAYERMSAAVASALNRITTSMTKTAASVAEKSDIIKEKLLSTAEASNVAAGGFNAFGAAGALLGGGIVVGMLGEMLNKFVDTGVAIGNMANNLGVSVDWLSKMEYVAKRSEVSFEGFESSMKKFTVAQGKALAGSENQITAFKKMGVSIEDLKSMTPDELFMKVADGFQAMNNPAERNNAAMLLFGKNWTAVAPMLAKGSDEMKRLGDEASRMGGIWTNETVAAVRTFDAQLTILEQQIKGASMPILLLLLRAVEGLAVGFSYLYDILKVVIGAIVTGMVNLGTTVFNVGKILYKAFTGDWKGVLDTYDSFISTSKGMWAAYAKDVKDSFAGTTDMAKKFFTDGAAEPPPTFKAGDDSDAKAKKDDSMKLVRQFEDQLNQMKLVDGKYHEVSLSEEIAFWAKKLDLVQKGTDAEKAIRSKIVELTKTQYENDTQVFLHAEADKMKVLEKTSSERIAVAKETFDYLVNKYGAESKEAREAADNIKAITEEVKQAKEKAADDAAKHQAELDAIYENTTRAHSAALLNLEIQRINDLEKLGVISSKNALRRRQELETQEQAAILKSLEKERDMYSRLHAQHPMNKDYDKQLAEFNGKILAQNDKMRALELAHETQTNQKRQQGFHQTFGIMAGSFSSALNSMMSGQASFGQAMQQMFSQILQGFINMLLDMVMTFVEKHLFMLIFGKAKAAESIPASAGQAGAAAYASTAAIPIIGPGLAPAAAAAASAGAMSYVAMASAAQGWDRVPHDTVANIHKDEMVMSAPLAQGIRDLISGGGQKAGRQQIHVSQHVTAFDRKGVERVMQNNGRTLIKEIKRQLRNGARL